MKYRDPPSEGTSIGLQRSEGTSSSADDAFWYSVAFWKCARFAFPNTKARHRALSESQALDDLLGILLLPLTTFLITIDVIPRLCTWAILSCQNWRGCTFEIFAVSRLYSQMWMLTTCTSKWPNEIIAFVQRSRSKHCPRRTYIPNVYHGCSTAFRRVHCNFKIKKNKGDNQVAELALVQFVLQNANKILKFLDSTFEQYINYWSQE